MESMRPACSAYLPYRRPSSGPVGWCGQHGHDLMLALLQRPEGLDARGVLGGERDLHARCRNICRSAGRSILPFAFLGSRSSSSQRVGSM